MKQMGLIKPNEFAGLRMSCHSLTRLPRPQPVAAFPFKLHSGLATVSLHSRFARRVKNLMPGKVYAITIIAHVHHAFFHKALPDLWVDPLEYLAAASDRRLSSLLGTLQTKEEDPHWPVARI